MQRSAADVARAARLRKKPKMSPGERQWLDAYDRSVKRDKERRRPGGRAAAARADQRPSAPAVAVQVLQQGEDRRRALPPNERGEDWAGVPVTEDGDVDQHAILAAGNRTDALVSLVIDLAKEVRTMARDMVQESNARLGKLERLHTEMLFGYATAVVQKAKAEAKAHSSDDDDGLDQLARDALDRLLPPKVGDAKNGAAKTEQKTEQKSEAAEG